MLLNYRGGGGHHHGSFLSSLSCTHARAFVCVRACTRAHTHTYFNACTQTTVRCCTIFQHPHTHQLNKLQSEHTHRSASRLPTCSLSCAKAGVSHTHCTLPTQQRSAQSLSRTHSSNFYRTHIPPTWESPAATTFRTSLEPRLAVCQWRRRALSYYSD